MIFFLGGSEIFVIVVVFIALLVGAVEFIAKAISFLFIAFMVKNIIQTIIIGYFKNHTPLKRALFCLAMDIIRVCSFFYFFSRWVDIYASSSGLAHFLNLFFVCIFTILSGSAFIVGELLSFMHAQNDDNNTLSLFSDIVSIGGILLVGWFSTL